MAWCMVRIMHAVRYVILCIVYNMVYGTYHVTQYVLPGMLFGSGVYNMLYGT